MQEGCRDVGGLRERREAAQGAGRAGHTDGRLTLFSHSARSTSGKLTWGTGGALSPGGPPQTTEDTAPPSPVPQFPQTPAQPRHPPNPNICPFRGVPKGGSRCVWGCVGGGIPEKGGADPCGTAGRGVTAPPRHGRAGSGPPGPGESRHCRKARAGPGLSRGCGEPRPGAPGGGRGGLSVGRRSQPRGTPKNGPKAAPRGPRGCPGGVPRGVCGAAEKGPGAGVAGVPQRERCGLRGSARGSQRGPCGASGVRGQLQRGPADALRFLGVPASAGVQADAAAKPGGGAGRPRGCQAGTQRSRERGTQAVPWRSLREGQRPARGVPARIGCASQTPPVPPSGDAVPGGAGTAFPP